MKRAFITGITGQDGIYLAELLAGEGYLVYGLARGGTGHRRSAAVLSAVPDARLIGGDLTDPASLTAALAESQPDEVYNLGGISFVGTSWEMAGATADVCARGALNLLEATRLYAGRDPERVRYYQASSSEMFGNAQDVPQHERTAFWPRSPYGVAKAFGHFMTINYRESYGLHASSGILYNHESPRRGHEFVTRKISRSVARISLGLQDTIVMGNLDGRRDWGFAGDYVRAMWLMLRQDTADDYIVATGETHSVRDFLALAFSSVGIEDWAPLVTVDPGLLRPTEGADMVGDASKARDRLGWAPTVGFEDLVSQMVANDLTLEMAGTAP